MSVHLENAVTRRFGVEWIGRPDGQGSEIKGVPVLAMKAFLVAANRRREGHRREAGAPVRGPVRQEAQSAGAVLTPAEGHAGHA